LKGNFVLRGQRSIDFYIVSFFDMILRVQQLKSQRTIVGNQKKAFGISIQPSDRVKIFFFYLLIQQIQDSQFFSVAIGSDCICGFIQHVVTVGRAADLFSLKSNLLQAGINVLAEFVGGLTIH